MFYLMLSLRAAIPPEVSSVKMYFIIVFIIGLVPIILNLVLGILLIVSAVKLKNGKTTLFEESNDDFTNIKSFLNKTVNIEKVLKPKSTVLLTFADLTLQLHYLTGR